MNIIVLVDSYDTNMTMGGIIGKNVIDLLKKENRVTVVCLKTDIKQEKDYVIDNVHVIRMKRDEDKYLRIKTYNIRNKLEEIINKSHLLFTRAKLFIKHNIAFTGMNKSIYKNCVKILEKLYNKQNIDIVLSISSPYELNYAAYMFKKRHPEIKHIVYQLDYFSKLPIYHYIKRFEGKRIKERENVEDQVIKNADKYYTLPFIAESYMKSDLRWKKKIRSCEFALIKKQELINTSNGNKLRMIFTGSLTSTERNPKYLFDILMKLPNDFEYTLDIYQRGNCNDIIEKYCKMFKNKIVNHGFITSRLAYEEIGSSDILISISTIKGNQVAGKTFDYISTGKPIIYIYFSEEDVNLQYFKKYTLSLCINAFSSSCEENAQKIFFFCEESSQKKIAFSKIRELYSECTPEYVVNKLMSV